MKEEKFPVRKFYSGDVVFREGELGDDAYVIQKGRVEISLGSGEDKVILDELAEGDVFGEISVLLKGQRRTATATVLELSDIVEITKSAFLEAVEDAPPVIRAVLHAAVMRLQKTTSRVVSAPDPLVATGDILHLMVSHEVGEIEYYQALRSVSSALNLTGEIIEGVLVRLKEAGLIEIGRNKTGRKSVVILNPEEFSDGVKKLR